jgi:hypothetical protein
LNQRRKRVDTRSGKKKACGYALITDKRVIEESVSIRVEEKRKRVVGEEEKLAIGADMRPVVKDEKTKRNEKRKEEQE